MFSLADIILFAALAITSTFAALLHRRLRRLDAYHADYGRALAETAEALHAVHDAVDKLNCDGRALAGTLGEKIAQAQAVIAELDAVRRGEPRQLAAGGEATVTRLRVRPHVFGAAAGGKDDAALPAAPRNS